MEEVNNNRGNGLAVGALVTGIIAFLMAVIPCVGVIAIIPAAIAIVLGIVGLSRAHDNNGMLVGGLVVGIIAVMISVSQIFVFSKIADHSDSWASEFERTMQEIRTDIKDDVDGGDVSIKISSKGDSLEINAKASGKDLEKQLDELESDTDSVTVSIKVTK